MITRGATISDLKITTTVSLGTLSHTVDVGTTLMLVYVGMEGIEGVLGIPTFNTIEDLVLIRDTGIQSANSETRSYIYGLINPTATTANIFVDFVSSLNPAWIGAVNYKGTNAVSVAAATNFLSEDVNLISSNTAVHASGGVAGNALVMVGHAQGADTNPSSQTAGTSFTEVFDVETGPANTDDFGCWWGEILSGVPSAITLTWGATDQNSSILIELVTAATAGNPWYAYAQQ